MFRKIPSYFTVEAAFVMTVVFSLLSAVILFSFSLHDRFLAETGLKEAVLLTSENDGASPVFQEYLSSASSGTDLLFSGNISFRTEKNGGTVTGTASGNSLTLKMEKTCPEPEKLLREAYAAKEIFSDLKDLKKEALE